MPGPRRLAAIMFTDLAGFTELAQADEARALASLEEQRKIVAPLVQLHNGRIVKSMGDGMLIEFPDARGAVAAALDVQRHLREAEVRPGSTALRMRIGVHLGDVQEEGTDIVGDAVNIASRLEPLAEPGGICVSEQVYLQVRNKLPAEFVLMGLQRLKGLQEPLQAYRVSEAANRPPVPDPATVSISRLAVLPFANMSPDPQDEYFADGLTEEVTSELSRLGGVQIIARTSAMRFKGGARGVKEVGKELGVQLVLEGSVRKAANRLRVTTQLIDASTEAHVWGEKYDRELNDIFAVQSEIASHVASQLGLTLSRAHATNASGDLDAYFLYLKGRHLWNRRSATSVRQALELFERAVTLDPGLALAYTGIADCWMIRQHNHEDVSWAEAGPKVKAAISEALRLQESLPEAHASLALAYADDYEWGRAEPEFLRAIELNPSYSAVRNWYHIYLQAVARPAEAARQLDIAYQLDPFSPVILMNQGNLSATRGERTRAESFWKACIELDTELNPMLHFQRIMFRSHWGEQDGALSAFRAVEGIYTDESGKAEEEFWGYPAAALALVGRLDDARRSVERLHAIARGTYVPARSFSFADAALGDSDRFFEWTSRAIDDHSADPGQLQGFPITAQFLRDPRAGQIWRQFGLPAR